MNRKEFQDINNRLSSLTYFRGFHEVPIYEDFSMLQIPLSEDDESSREEDGWEEGINRNIYGSLCRHIYEAGGNISHLVLNYLLSGDDFIIHAPENKEIERARDFDLATLQMLADLTSAEVKSVLFSDSEMIEELPGWENSKINLKAEFDSLLSGLSTKGYGIFYNNKMFRIRDGMIIPVENADYQSLDELYEYERERNLVIKNTEAFVSGEMASNVLLYGDAGTGKSTTVKAVAASFDDRGLRLIEFDKNQVHEIPAIAEEVSKSPLKFIFFIDDLTFNDNDDNFYALKGILEGTARGKGRNTLIYATSNRRHLVKESMADRVGDDLHLNDTLQETMSLSSRFGLTITFQKPAKDIYLSIVESMAKEKGLLPSDKDPSYNDTLLDMFTKAEAFAIRMNGRSPRTAKQFITQLAIGLC